MTNTESVPEIEQETQNGSPELALESLRDHVSRILQTKKQFKDFISELEDCDIRLSVKLTKVGKVNRLIYTFDDNSFNSSDLGSEYTWSGLRKKLGMVFDPCIDFELLKSIEDKSERFKPQSSVNSDATLKAIEQLEEQNKHRFQTMEDRLLLVLDKLKSSEVDQLTLEFERLHQDTQSISRDFSTFKQEENEIFREQMESLDTIIKTLEANSQAVLPAHTPDPLAYNTEDLEQMVEKLHELSKSVIIYSHQATQNVDAATHHLKRSTVWIALSAALFSGIISAGITALWTNHNTATTIQATQEQISSQVQKSENNILNYIDEQAANDPLRRYFEKIMDKL